jgi:hypothetical protein
MSNYPKTEDGHYFIVDGRKWRATDPNIPEQLEKQLVSVLMNARRDVAKANRKDDKTLEEDARQRVSDAKIALGERGAVWWESYSDEDLRTRLRSTILTLLRHREEGKSICPSEAARVVGIPEEWQELMPATREVAVALAHEGKVVITRGDEVLDPDELGKGPIRLRHGAVFTDT